MSIKIEEIVEETIERLEEEKKTAIKLEKIIEESVEKALAEKDKDVIDIVVEKKSNFSKKIKSMVASVAVFGSTPYFTDAIFEQTEQLVSVTINELQEFDVFLKKLHNSLKH